VASGSERFQGVKNLQAQLPAARRASPRTLPAAAARALQGSRGLGLTKPENLADAEPPHWTELKPQLPRLAPLAAQRESRAPPLRRGRPYHP